MRRPEASQLVVRLDPSTGIRLVVDAKRGDAPQPERVTLDVEFANEGGEAATPYEVLLDAAMRGESMRFTRQDAVEEQWRIMQPPLDAPPRVPPSARGPGARGGGARLPRGLGGGHGPGGASCPPSPAPGRPRRPSRRAPRRPPRSRRSP